MVAAGVVAAGGGNVLASNVQLGAGAQPFAVNGSVAESSVIPGITPTPQASPSVSEAAAPDAIPSAPAASGEAGGTAHSPASENQAPVPVPEQVDRSQPVVVDDQVGTDPSSAPGSPSDSAHSEPTDGSVSPDPTAVASDWLSCVELLSPDSVGLSCGAEIALVELASTPALDDNPDRSTIVLTITNQDLVGREIAIGLEQEGLPVTRVADVQVEKTGATSVDVPTIRDPQHQRWTLFML